MPNFSSKGSWDKQTWLLGLFLGNLAGLLLLCGGYPPPRRFLETAFPYTAFGYYTGDLVRLLGFLCGALIFPAFLTATAKQFYFLWGLLPFAPLTFWTVLGIKVTHASALSPDTAWAIPVFALFCWIIASLPISLFRFFRYRRFSAKGAHSSVSAERPPSRVAILVLLGSAAALVILGYYNFKYPIQTTGEMQSHWPSGKEVHVPLIKRGTAIYVRATLNGQEETCKVDTGAESVEWPRGLHLSGRLTKLHSQSCDILGRCVAIQTVLLPHIKIGEYEVTNLPTEMSDLDAGLFSPPAGPADEVFNLGNPAFVMSVLTIDYKNAILTIHPLEYDFTRQQRKPGDRVLQMGWTTHYPDKDWQSRLYGSPAVRATIDDVSFWCTLDTGAGGPEICLDRNLATEHPSFQKYKRDLVALSAANSSARVERLHDLNVKFPCLVPAHADPVALHVNGLVTPTPKDEEANGMGVIGLPLMERYRITIDYQRRRVLLEPYAQDVTKQKQEKSVLSPKLSSE